MNKTDTWQASLASRVGRMGDAADQQAPAPAVPDYAASAADTYSPSTPLDPYAYAQYQQAAQQQQACKHAKS